MEALSSREAGGLGLARASERRAALAVGLAVFVSGAVLLGVEITASRVLAPYFGNSLYVWGALIGVVLAGLAAGYWLGGALGDRLPAPAFLVAVLGTGALCVLAVPLLDGPVLEAVVAWDPGPRLDPLLAAILLFGAPSVVLAAVSPIALRLRARSVASVGRTAGRLYALSTAGSIVGTLGTAFWLIPVAGTHELLGLAAATLFATAALVAASERMAPAFALAALAAGASAAVAVALAPGTGGTLSAVAAQNWSPVYRLREDPRTRREPVEASGLKVVFAKDTQYHRLTVVDSEGTRYLRFDSSFQSAMRLRRPFGTAFRYTDFFHLGLVYNPAASNVLFVGLGGGSSPKRMWREFPELELQAVELDPVVVDVAHRYFSVPRHPRLRIAVDDGRRYLARHPRRWDVIAIDAFFADGIPFHLVTREFLELARSRLAAGGVIVTNVIGAIEGDNSRLFRSIYRTYRSVFPTVLVHPVVVGSGETDESIRNLILVATERAASEPRALLDRWARWRASVPAAPDLRRPILDRHDEPISLEGVPLLTDDYAPTDALLLD